MPLVRGLVHVADQHLELTDLGPTPLGGAAVTLAPQAAELAPEWFCQRSRQTACLSCRSGAGGVQDKGTGTRRDCVANWFAAATERPECTARGYRRFRCRDCGRQFNGLGCSVCTCLRPEPWFGMAGRRRLGQIRVGLAFKGRQFAAEVILWGGTVVSHVPGQLPRPRPHASRPRGGGPLDPSPPNPSLCPGAGETNPAPSAPKQSFLEG
jgi:hypothetical protein